MAPFNRLTMPLSSYRSSVISHIPCILYSFRDIGRKLHFHIPFYITIPEGERIFLRCFFHTRARSLSYPVSQSSVKKTTSAPINERRSRPPLTKKWVNFDVVQQQGYILFTPHKGVFNPQSCQDTCILDPR